MSHTELIIFDLGRVLVDFDFRKVVRDLARHSPLAEDGIHRYFAATPLWDAFERGSITPERFFAQLTKELRLTGLDFEAFTPLWNSIFTEKPATVEILRKLRGRYRLAMLSNVNIMHWQHIRDRHDFMRWFDYPVPSYETGYRKPDAEIFRYTLRQAGGVAPERAVFIDDMEGHIQAARAIGIRAFQFLTAERLRADLDGILE